MPTLAIRLRVESSGPAPIRSVLLDTQIQIAARLRTYGAAEQDRLHDLFGTPERWPDTLRTLPWTRLTTVVPPFSGNTLVDVTYAASDDGGATWRSVRVSTAGFDPSLYGVPFGSTIRPFIGDYNAIVSLADRAGLAWTGVGPTSGRLNTNLEIFFGSVTP